MDMDPSYCMADPMEGTHRGGMLRPSMHPIKPQPAMVPCCAPQHPKTPPQPIIGHRCARMEESFTENLGMYEATFDQCRAASKCSALLCYALQTYVAH